ncbi:MAG: TIM barrel protein [Planctomycetota bacterium]|nr:TIM barrel protein [Planctomycetota bacterium]MDA1177959.1 TIM barrel protein [Planctomycetota bacterium]
MSPRHRRDFVRQMAHISLAVAATRSVSEMTMRTADAADTEPQTDSFCAFTESFQAWPIPQVCAKFREIGLNGLDLTVRPGGHIEPEKVATELPLAVKSAKEHGIRISMLSTSIGDADANAEKILSVAGEHGIRRIKMGYHRYTRFGQLLEEMDESRRRIERIAKLAARFNVLPCVHIHSGALIPSGGSAAYLLLRDVSPTEVGAYVDPMHMTIEGGIDGWRQGLDLLRPWIALSSLKNCIWTANGRDEFGQQRWSPKKCPLADGIAPIPDYLQRLREGGYHGLYTLHSEYTDKNSWKQLTVDECLEQTRLDFEYAKGCLKHPG